MSFDLAGIFGAGLLTFLSPCILPLVPLYLSFLAGVSLAELKETSVARRPWGAAIAFCLGLSAVFVALGMAASALGGVLAEHRLGLLQFGGVALLLVGLKQLGVIQIPWLDREARPWLNRVQGGGGAVAGFLFGAAFGLGWTPCIGPVLGGVLTYTAAASANPLEGALYLATYAAGLSLPLLAVAAAAPWALRVLERARRHLRKFEVASGALLSVMGVLLFTDSLAALVPSAGPAEAPIASASTSDALESPTVDDIVGVRDVDGSGAADGTVAGVPSDPADAADRADVVDAAVLDALVAGVDGPPIDRAAATAAECALPEGGGAAGCELPALDVAPGPPGEALAVTRATMIEFVSDTCSVCERMKPVVAMARQFCATSGVEVRLVDVGTDEGRRLAARHGVRGVPTFLFVDGEGRELTRKIGEQSLPSLQQGIESLSGTQCAALGPSDGAKAPVTADS